jgi:meiotically up-regulated gene 157 (Mug157) protein
MHESFQAGDPTSYSRPWFAWANALFGQLVIDLAKRFPSFMLKGDLRAINGFA